MSIGLRDITQLEEILEASEGDKIIVIRNGEAKLMNGADIGGGGKVTNYYMQYTAKAASAPPVLYVDEDGIQLVTVEDAYDALNSGIVYIIPGNSSYIKKCMVTYFSTACDDDGSPIGMEIYYQNGSYVDSLVLGECLT